MSVSAFTSRGENVELEDFPSFCVIRDDIIEDGDRVPVGNQYIRKDKIYLSAWDITLRDRERRSRGRVVLRRAAFRLHLSVISVFGGGIITLFDASNHSKMAA